ncbi:RNA polymerase sigma-70 factor [Rapidithrix thailandica]|uniref:RNA polymerase sigma factor n=1 Tax=Rapidithrix thailandica TaxID=413964 RepID=A0AAW9S203_9BACT
MNEKQLVISLNQGDESAFQSLFDLYSSRLYLYCFRFLKSKDLSDEIVQGVFIKIWEQRANVNPEFNFSAFIFKVAKNLLVDFLRKMSREEEAKMELQLKTQLYQSLPEDEMIYSELKKLIEDAVHKLPEKRQRIFRMSRFEGLSHEEIARQLGLSKNTVKVSIFKSLCFLREYLASHDKIKVSYLLLLFLMVRK